MYDTLFLLFEIYLFHHKNVYNQYKNKTKENIEEILNKSFNDFSINTNKNLIKKSYFDDIKTSLNKNNIIIQHKEFDYDNFYQKC